MTMEDARPVAIVTGSTKGIGKGIAVALAAQGVRVVITGRSAERAEAMAHSIRCSGGTAVGLPFDIEQIADTDNLLSAANQIFGRLDILINNAVSQSCLIPSAEFTDHQIMTTLSTNINHTFLLCCKALPLLKQRQGCIVNIGSVIVNRHLQGLPLYGIVKGAINHMTKVLSAEWAGVKVRVNGINPGFIRSQALADLGLGESFAEEAYQYYADYQPLAGVGEPGAVADAVVFLALERARFITGAILDVDGGYSTKALSLYVRP